MLRGSLRKLGLILKGSAALVAIAWASLGGSAQAQINANPNPVVINAPTWNTSGSTSVSLTDLTEGASISSISIPPAGSWVSGATAGSFPVTWTLTGNPVGQTPGTTIMTTVTITDSQSDVLMLPVSLVIPAQPSLTVTGGPLTFNTGTWITAPASQTLSVNGGGSVANFTVTPTMNTGSMWLTAGPNGITGAVAQSVTVSVSPATLTPGQTYTGSVTIASNALTGSPQIIPVTYTVPLPVLTVTGGPLTFNGGTWSSPPAGLTLTVNAQGATAAYMVTSDSPPWLTAGPNMSTGAQPQTVNVSVNPATLTPGQTYTGHVTVTGTGTNPASVIVPVSYTVPAAPLTVNPNTLTFTSSWNDVGAGNQTAASQSVSVWGGGYAGQFNVTIPGNCAWLTFAYLNGNTTPALTTPNVSFSVNAAGLTPGTQVTCLATIAPAQADLAVSQTVTVHYTPAPAPLTVDKTTLNYVSTRWNLAPASQTLGVWGGGYAGNFTVAVALNPVAWQGALPNWLTVAPVPGTAQMTPAVFAQNVTVSPNPANLIPGHTYTATLTITNSAADLLPVPSPLTVTVSYTVPPALFTVNGSNTAMLNFASPKWNSPTNLQVPQTVSVYGDGYAGSFTVAVAGGAWLTATPGTASTPASITPNVTVSVNPAGLTPNQIYTATITIANVNPDLSTSAPLAIGGPIVVTVSYFVPPAVVTLTSVTGDPGTYSLTPQQNPPSVAPSAAYNIVINRATVGQGLITEKLALYADGYSAHYAISSALPAPAGTNLDPSVHACNNPPNWFAVTSPANASLPETASAVVALITPAVSAANVAFAIDPAVLTPGCRYTANVTLTDTDTPLTTTTDPAFSTAFTGTVPANQNGTIGVTVSITVPPLHLYVTPPSGANFTYTLGSPVPGPQSIQVSALYDVSNGVAQTQETIPFKIGVSTTDGGNWLSASAASPVQTPEPITISINPGNMKVGQYSGSITVTPSALAQGAPAPVGSSVTIGVSLTVTGSTIFTVAPKSLSFNVDPSSPYLASQSISVFSSLPGVTFTASSSGAGFTATGGGSVPGNVTVSVNPGNLQGGLTYSGTVTISGGNATGEYVIPVSIRTAAVTPVMALTNNNFNLSFAAGASPSVQEVAVYNTGGGSFNYTATVQGSNCGSSWLTILTSSGAVTSAQPTPAVFQVDPTGQSGNTCNGTVHVAGAGSSADVPVSMVVSSATSSILLSQAGVNFISASGTTGSIPPPQSFAVLNPGSSTLPWTVDTSQVPSWLTVSPSSGSSDGGSSNVTPVIVGLNAAAVAALNPTSYPATYYVSLPVNASSARNSPQAVTVSLTLLPPGQSPPPQVSPSGLVFVAQTTSAPSPQTVVVSNSGVNDLTFNSISQMDTDSSSQWLAVSPAGGAVPKGGNVTLTIGASAKGLSDGRKHGTIRIAFADQTSVTQTQTVDVVLNVAGGAGLSSSSAIGDTNLVVSKVSLNRFRPLDVAVCGPISAGFANPGADFSEPTNSPVQIQLSIKDCNGNALKQGSVSATVTSGTGAGQTTTTVAMSPVNGLWTGQWNTPSASAANGAAIIPASISFSVVENTGGRTTFSSASGTISGNVTTTNGLTKPSPSAVLNAASFATDSVGLITPGAWVAIYGLPNTTLGGQPSTASGNPYPNQLSGVQVTLQGKALPLFYADANQVNALIPQGVNTSEQQQLLVIRTTDNTQSVGIPLSVSNAQPAIFTTSGNGIGQGAIINVDTGTVAAPLGTALLPDSAPVKVGRSASVYCTGLGPVQNGPADGAITPTDQLYPVINSSSVTVILGDPAGSPATVSPTFAGLAPLLVGVYQVNFMVPPNSPTGDAVPLAIQVGNITSQVATMAISQ